MLVRLGHETREFRTVWFERGDVRMIDQQKLPHSFEVHSCKSWEEVAEAIEGMVIRGAPAIGAAAAYALAQAVTSYKGRSLEELFERIEEAKCRLEATRPTANDLFFALESVCRITRSANSVKEAKELAVKAAEAYAELSARVCSRIGEIGQHIVPTRAKILTHCNAGALGCVDHGTALAVIRAAHRRGKGVFVYVDETRPRLQGAALTAWELGQEGIPYCVIVDNAAGYYLWRGEIDLVIVGADRVAANGDIANKIGTYEKAVVAHENSVPFYVAAPLSTFDFSCESGKHISIEERSEEEVLTLCGSRIAPATAKAKNPAFDVTPAKYVTGIITEHGIFKPSEISELEELQARFLEEIKRLVR